MKITIMYDNTSFRKDLQFDWGFSAFIEVGEKKILFDAGAKGDLLLSNMQKLKIDPKEIRDVFISHAHWDHTGGLSSFLNINNNAQLWIPPSFEEAKITNRVIEVGTPTKLYDGIYSTGELDKIEQSLCVETKKGIVVIVGCSHPKMEHILQTASQFGRVYGIIGGLHGTKPDSLRDLDLICPTHCTQYKSEIKHIYPKQYIEGGAGKIIDID